MASKPGEVSKESIIKLQDLQNKFIRVKFSGGREITGVLKNYDPNLNLIVDDCVESIRSQEDPYVITDQTRKLGVVVIRGNLISAISSLEGMEVISNPFEQIEEMEQE